MKDKTVVLKFSEEQLSLINLSIVENINELRVTS